MREFKVAYICQQGKNLIVVPLQPDFEYKSASQKLDLILELQRRAEAAGLAGTVIPMWKVGNEASFIAPPATHSFFSSFSWDMLHANLNKVISWQE